MKMKLQLLAAVASLALPPMALPAEDANESADKSADEIVVVGRSVATRTATIEVEKELLVDTATALRDIPGATANRNGPLTGIAQYRGMFGDRVAVEIAYLFSRLFVHLLSLFPHFKLPVFLSFPPSSFLPLTLLFTPDMT